MLNKKGDVNMDDMTIKMLISAMVTIIAFLICYEKGKFPKPKSEIIKEKAEAAGTVAIGTLISMSGHRGYYDEKNPNQYPGYYNIVTYAYQVDGKDYQYRCRTNELPPERVKLFYLKSQPDKPIADGIVVKGAKFTFMIFLSIFVFILVFFLLGTVIR